MGAQSEEEAPLVQSSVTARRRSICDGCAAWAIIITLAAVAALLTVWPFNVTPPRASEDLDQTQALLRESKLGLVPQGPGRCFSVCQNRVCRHVENGTLWSASGAVRERTLPNGSNKVIQCYGNGNATDHVRRVFKVPDYFVVGYSQAGSTFFHTLLTRHPQVKKACKKEINFFDQRLYRLGRKHLERSRTKLGRVDQYLECFGAPDDGKLVGDNTIKTIYTDPAFPLWLQAINPDIKLIVLIRNPIDRAVSRYALKGAGLGCEKHMDAKFCKSHFGAYVKRQISYARAHCPNLDADPFEAYRCSLSYNQVKIDADTLLSSLYGPHVAHWMRFFPREQFLFVQSERLFQNPQATMVRVSNFLHLATFEGFTVRAGTANHNSHKKSSTAPVSAALAHELERFFNSSTQLLSSITGTDWFARWGK